MFDLNYRCKVLWDTMREQRNGNCCVCGSSIRVKLHDEAPENMHVHGLNLRKIGQYYTVCDRLTLSI